MKNDNFAKSRISSICSGIFDTAKQHQKNKQISVSNSLAIIPGKE